jgi:hypothetical protein
MKPLASRDKVTAFCHDVVNGGITKQVGSVVARDKRAKSVKRAERVVSDKKQFENVAFTSSGFSAQKVRDGAERVVHIVVKARRGVRKVVVADYEMVLPSKR